MSTEYQRAWPELSITSCAVPPAESTSGNARGHASLAPATTAHVEAVVVAGAVACSVTNERSGRDTSTTVLKYEAAPGVTVSEPGVVGIPATSPLAHVSLGFTDTLSVTPRGPSTAPVS